MEFHKEKLQHLCRVCGRQVNSEKYRKSKDAIVFEEQLLYFGIELKNDSDEIHPKLICEKCRKTFANMKRKTEDKLKEYRPNLIPFHFEPHSDNCFVCDQRAKKSGRKPALKNVNQFSNPGNIICHPVEKVKDVAQSIEPLLFTHSAIQRHAEALGYAVFPEETAISCIILTKRNEPILQLRNLLTITISNDRKWQVFVDTVGISSNLSFCSFPDILKDFEQCKELLNTCSQLTFCPGNSDFIELCKSRQHEGNRALFRDRKNCIVAKEVNDVICMALDIDKTIRHESCAMIVSNHSSSRCENCLKYRSTLVALNAKLRQGKLPLSKREIKPTSSSFIPHKHMSNEQLSHKLNHRKVENETLKKENIELKKRLQELIESQGVSGEESLSDALKTTIEQKNIIDTLPEGSAIKLLFEEQIKQTKLKNSKQMRWHPTIIRWCLGIYHTSPAAYEFLKSSSFLRLPHKSTLLDYTMYTKPGAGFNPDILRRLYEEADVPKLNNETKNMSVLMDEMKIKSELVYNKSSGKLVGFVELDSVSNEIDKLERVCSETGKEKDIATHVLAFMVRGIYSKFLFCFAHFPTKSLTCDVIFPLAWKAVSFIESIGLKVRCFVSDGASPNRKFYKMHKKPEDKSLPFFAINLCAKDRKIYLVCDVPHLIKTVRNNWENSHGNRNTRNLMFEGQSISWNHLVSLKNFDSNPNVPGLYLTKLKTEHIKLTPSSRMSVKLAAQALGETVANGLKFQGKADTKGTENFIRMFDYFFDCLNGRFAGQGQSDKKAALHPYREINDKRFEWLEKNFLDEYILKWKTEANSKTMLTVADRKKLCLSDQTLEGLQITVKSHVAMMKELIQENPGFFILSGRFSQDPLEQHFSAQRKRCGANTAPTAEQVAQSELALHSIKSKNVASMRGNTTIDVKDQQSFMEDNSVPLKRRKWQKQ